MAYKIQRKVYLNIQDEKIAAGNIYPGMLVERLAADTVQAHSTANGTAQKLFAIEDAYQGNGIDDKYEAEDNVILWLPTPGDVVYAILDATTGMTIAIGDFLMSAGDGRVTDAEALVDSSADVPEYPAAIIGVALEAADAGEHFDMEIL